MKPRNALKRLALIFLAIAFLSFTLAPPFASVDAKGYSVTAEMPDTVDDKEETPEKDDPLPAPLFHLCAFSYHDAAGYGTRLTRSQNHPLPLFEPPRS